MSERSILSQSRLFAAQVTNKDRLRLARMLLQVGGELMKGSDEIAGFLRQHPSKFAFCLIKFLDQHAVDQGGLAREMRVERFFAHPDVSGEIIHGDVFEAVGHEMETGTGEDAARDGIGRERG